MTGPVRRTLAAVAALALLWGPARAAAEEAVAVGHEAVRVVKDDSGMRLQVAGRDFLVRGVNWDYCPIGQNYAYNLWAQPDDFITAALDREMGLLAAMGANTIRIYAGIPPRWVKYLHDRYGVYCIINHTVGRYGFTLDGMWNPVTDYSNPRMRAAIAADVAATFAPYKGVPGVLMYLLGNENNYGLSWSSFEIEALPKGERDAARARKLYSLMGEIAAQTKAADPDVPVALCNGDVQYIDIIAEECKALDVFGSNVYRGISARDMYEVVKTKLGVPLLFTEFGSDAFNARTMSEDQAMQAKYLIGQWREIYEQSAGHGRVANAIGGCVFQWSDGWWKFGQDKRLDVHDTNASWPDGAYTEDFVQGDNNMNEEWWGICAKGRPDERGLYELYPRAGYYALQKAFAFDPYGASDADIARHFAGLTPASAELSARGDRAALQSESSQRVRLSGMRMNFETVTTGGALTTTPRDVAALDPNVVPSVQGFDHLQSFFFDFEAKPANNVTGFLSMNALGHVPTNPIDQIFYEARVNSPRVVTHLTDRDRIVHTYDVKADRPLKVYQARLSWDDRWFTADGFYRTGHYHWGYEGDFFGLYREANYGPNIDIYDADVPIGVEFAGKRALGGWKLAIGPELWWGANPAVLMKYNRRVLGYDATLVQQYDLSSYRGSGVSSANALPVQTTRKTSLDVKGRAGRFEFEAAGLWAGANRVGRPFQVIEGSGADARVMRDEIRAGDAFGGKLKLTSRIGPAQWYAQAAHMGLVAEGGPTGTQTLTGWMFKDTGLGNQQNVLTGFLLSRGNFTYGPNLLWQKPIVGPMPADAPGSGRLRNIVDDPFAVRGNREMTGAELLINYDPTPASYLWAWDNDLREESRLAGSLSFAYKHEPTSTDAAIGFLADGVTRFAFDRGTPARDHWVVNARAVSRLNTHVRIVAHAYVGTFEPSSIEASRTTTPGPAQSGRTRRQVASGGDVRIAGHSTAFTAYAKFQDWGPYDYHRDFDLTFPVQLIGDLSHTLGTPLWLDSQQTRLGVRGTWRSLDPFSPRYAGLTGDPNGSEWEVRTYVRLAM